MRFGLSLHPTATETQINAKASTLSSEWVLCPNNPFDVLKLHVFPITTCSRKECAWEIYRGILETEMWLSFKNWRADWLQTLQPVGTTQNICISDMGIPKSQWLSGFKLEELCMAKAHQTWRILIEKKIFFKKFWCVWRHRCRRLLTRSSCAPDFRR